MSKATPINQLTNSIPSGGDETMQMPIVQDILNEIQQTDMSMSTPVVAPPTMTQDGRSEFNAPRMNYQMDPNIQAMPSQGFQNPNAMSNMLQYQQQLLTPPKVTTSTIDVILREAKLPLLSSLIFLIIASPKIMNVITQNIAFTMTEGVVNTSGYVFLAVVAGVLFYLGKLLMSRLS